MWKILFLLPALVLGGCVTYVQPPQQYAGGASYTPVSVLNTIQAQESLETASPGGTVDQWQTHGGSVTFTSGPVKRTPNGWCRPYSAQVGGHAQDGYACRQFEKHWVDAGTSRAMRPKTVSYHPPPKTDKGWW